MYFLGTVFVRNSEFANMSAIYLKLVDMCHCIRKQKYSVFKRNSIFETTVHLKTTEYFLATVFLCIEVYFGSGMQCICEE